MSSAVRLVAAAAVLASVPSGSGIRTFRGTGTATDDDPFWQRISLAEGIGDGSSSVNVSMPFGIRVENGTGDVRGGDKTAGRAGADVRSAVDGDPVRPEDRQGDREWTRVPQGTCVFFFKYVFLRTKLLFSDDHGVWPRSRGFRLENRGRSERRPRPWTERASAGGGTSRISCSLLGFFLVSYHNQYII